MEWTKIKTKHFLLSDMTLAEHGALSRILCLTAHLECVPTRQDILKIVPERCLDTLQSKLRIPLLEVLDKVLEDVSTLHHKRDVSKKTSKKHRDTAKSDTSLPLSRDTTEKRREEKRREEERRIYKEIVAHLNTTCSTNFKDTTKSTQTLIKTRLKEGHTVEDFKKVHSTKNKEWKGTDYEKFLRPETLYGNKFESYLQQSDKRSGYAQIG